MADKNYYLVINGKKQGPMSEDEIISLYKQGHITLETKYAQPGMKEWTPLSKSGLVLDSAEELPPLNKTTSPNYTVIIVALSVMIIFVILAFIFVYSAINKSSGKTAGADSSVATSAPETSALPLATAPPLAQATERPVLEYQLFNDEISGAEFNIPVGSSVENHSDDIFTIYRFVYNDLNISFSCIPFTGEFTTMEQSIAQRERDAKLIGQTAMLLEDTDYGESYITKYKISQEDEENVEYYYTSEGQYTSNGKPLQVIFIITYPYVDNDLYTAAAEETISSLTMPVEDSEPPANTEPTSSYDEVAHSIAKQMVSERLKSPSSAIWHEIELLEKDSYGRYIFSVTCEATNTYGGYVKTNYYTLFRMVSDSKFIPHKYFPVIDPSKYFIYGGQKASQSLWSSEWNIDPNAPEPSSSEAPPVEPANEDFPDESSNPAETENSPTNSTSINDCILQYLNNWAQAVNYNDFSRVEPFLLTGSELYDSQKALVSSLNERGITEEFVSATINQIEAIDPVRYEAHVTEEFIIYQTNGEFRTSAATYIYTIVDSGDQFYLTAIRN